jgi:hypothetical protein
MPKKRGILHFFTKIHSSCKKRINAIFYSVKFNILKHGSILKIADDSKFCIFSCYNRRIGENLAQLCDKYGSDKGSMHEASQAYPWRPHSYVEYYALLFEQNRETIKNVFECGIGTNNPSLESTMGIAGKPGASLRVWRDYFPNAQIIGADIDREILFQESRIKTYWVDQTSTEAIKSLWHNVKCDNFDLMIDDGLHEFHAGICLFENSIDKLSDFGHYIIEDVNLDDLIKYQQYFKNKDYIVNMLFIFRHSPKLKRDALILIQKIRTNHINI